MKQSSTFLLKVAVVLLGVPVLAIAILVLPRVAIVAFSEAANGSQLAYMILSILAGMYLSAIPYGIALYQAFKLLRYIDEEKAFSVLSIESLKKIKLCGYVISGVYCIILPFVFIVAEWDDAPGLVLMAMVIIGAAVLVSVFAAVLQKLLEEAMRIKTENELTI